MGRIVVNKHVQYASQIPDIDFIHKGSLVICNEIGSEGIYVWNNRNELVKVATNLSEASSAVTQEDIDALALQIEQVKSSVENHYYTKEETENKIIEIISGYTDFDIDEEAVRAIVNNEIDKLVDSADTEYNTIGKISRWIENSSGYDLTEIKEDISGLTQNIETIDDRLSIVEDIISGGTKSSDHFVMNFDQYQELITSGSVYVEGYDIITYNDNHFYCIYEEETPEPTPSGENVIMSGDTIIFDENYQYNDGIEDGEEPSLYIGTVEYDNNGVINVQWEI